MINLQIVAAVAHELRPPSSVLTTLTTRREPTARIADGGEHIWRLEFHVHCHGTATRPVSVLHDIGTGFTDSDEQVSDRARRGVDRRQPVAHRNADIPQRQGQCRHDQI